MGKSGSFKGDKPPNYKPVWWSSYSNNIDENSNICSACKEWTAELDRYGFCKENACRKSREKEGLKNGTMIRIVSDLPGCKNVIQVNGKNYKTK